MWWHHTKKPVRNGTFQITSSRPARSSTLLCKIHYQCLEVFTISR